MARWLPGQSGNPRGRRPKSVDPVALAAVTARARVAGVEAVETLIREMRSAANASQRIAAAALILDRGYGRALQPMDLPIFRLELKRALLDVAGGSPEGVAKLTKLLAPLEELAAVNRTIENAAADATAPAGASANGRAAS